MALDYDNRKIHTLVLEVTDEFEVDPDSPEGSRALFRELLTSYTGPNDTQAVAVWLREQIPKYFVALGERPRWIQEPEWPFANGKPMVFAGQIDITSEMGEEIIPKIFHDDTSFYVFFGTKVVPEVVMQQY